MKLRTRLVVALCLVGIVLGTTTYAGFELFQNRSVAQSEANVEETAAMSADIVEGRVRERKGQVAYVAAQPAARGDDVDAYIRSFVVPSDTDRSKLTRLVPSTGTRAFRLATVSPPVARSTPYRVSVSPRSMI